MPCYSSGSLNKSSTSSPTMGGEDPETAVRSYYDRIDAEDYDAVFALFAEDVTYHRPGQPAIDGLADLRHFYLEERPLSDGEHDVREVLVDGDTVVVRGRFSGTQDGDSVEFGFADFHVFDQDGLIIERHTYTDRDAI